MGPLKAGCGGGAEGASRLRARRAQSRSEGKSDAGARESSGPAAWTAAAAGAASLAPPRAPAPRRAAPPLAPQTPGPRGGAAWASATVPQQSAAADRGCGGPRARTPPSRGAAVSEGPPAAAIPAVAKPKGNPPVPDRARFVDSTGLPSSELTHTTQPYAINTPVQLGCAAAPQAACARGEDMFTTPPAACDARSRSTATGRRVPQHWRSGPGAPPRAALTRSVQGPEGGSGPIVAATGDEITACLKQLTCWASLHSNLGSFRGALGAFPQPSVSRLSIRTS